MALILVGGEFAGAIARYAVERLRDVLPEIDTMVGDGLITLERVEVVAYRGDARDGGHPGNGPSTSG